MEVLHQGDILKIEQIKFAFLYTVIGGMILPLKSHLLNFI